MLKEICFKSANGKDDIYAEVYQCENPKLIVQVLHGMCEHITRYESLAKFLNEHNIILAGNNHLGHGKSANTLGYFGEGENIDYVIADVNTLSEKLKEEYNLPIVYLGHSMGSFILRYYISKYPAEKIILMGTGYVNKATAKLLLNLSKIIGKIKGEDYTSKLLVSLTTNTFAKMVKGDKHDWISYNKENIEAFKKDPLSGFDFTVNGYKTLAQFLLTINNKKTINRTNKNIKILFLSGSDDPVGNFKKGVRQVYKLYKKAGFTNLKIRFFKDMRHEILNELDKDIVHDEILRYVEESE